MNRLASPRLAAPERRADSSAPRSASAADGPAQHVDVAFLDGGDGTVLDGHRRASLRAGLSCVTALEVAREHDPRVSRYDLPPAKGP